MFHLGMRPALYLYAKYKAKKAGKNNIVSPDTGEEPIPEEA